MDIQNISLLASQLEASGFGNLASHLLKRICFRPKTFSIAHTIEADGYRTDFELLFQQDGDSGQYSLQYFDAVQHLATLVVDGEVNGISADGLNAEMAKIDWKKAFDFGQPKTWNAADKASWKAEEEIETIMIQLERLEESPEGKSLAATLKALHWKSTNYTELFQKPITVANKSEISQRFYCVASQPCISIAEACRFLQNKRIEKEVKARRSVSATDESASESEAAGTGSLLRKKRTGRGGKSRK